MPDTRTYPQHDRRPAIKMELKDDDGFAVVLAASDTAYIVMRLVTDLTQVLRVSATIYTRGVASTGPDDPGTPAVVGWTPATSGAPSSWGGSGHHTGAAGIYDVETETQDSSGLPMTLPTAAPNTLIIRDDVDYP